jgi:hypothetical protein
MLDAQQAVRRQYLNGVADGQAIDAITRRQSGGQAAGDRPAAAGPLVYP